MLYLLWNKWYYFQILKILYKVFKLFKFRNYLFMHIYFLIHGYKNTTTHKNMAYMIVWLEMVTSHICHSHKCQVLAYCYYSPYIIVACLLTHLTFPYCCSPLALHCYYSFFTLWCCCLLLGVLYFDPPPPPPLAMCMFWTEFEIRH